MGFVGVLDGPEQDFFQAIGQGFDLRKTLII